MTKATTLMVECLENEGVSVVFGLPGEENIRFVQALAASGIRYVLTRHQQAAGPPSCRARRGPARSMFAPITRCTATSSTPTRRRPAGGTRGRNSARRAATQPGPWCASRRSSA